MSPDFYDALHLLATSPKAVQRRKASPIIFARSYPDLSKKEHLALKYGHSGLIRITAQQSPADIATRFVQAELRDPTLVAKYAAILKQYQNDVNGKDEISA